MPPGAVLHQPQPPPVPALPPSSPSMPQPAMSSERRVNVDLSPRDPTSAAARIRHVLAGTRVMRVLILSSDTGGGHRASAAALKAALLHMYPGRLRVHTADFWVDFAQGSFKAMPAQYAFLAKHPVLWKVTYELMRFPPVRAVVEGTWNTFAHGKIRSAFERYAPDLIISVHPLVNTLSLRVLKGIAAATHVPRSTFVTVVTDLGGCHPTWMHTGVDMTYVPTDAVRRVAECVGLAPDRIRQYGLPVRKAFWDAVQAESLAGEDMSWTQFSGGQMLIPAPPEKEELRTELGMRSGLTSLLIIGGGDGVGNLGRVAKAIAAKITRDHGAEGAQLVIVCGKNKTLLAGLEKHSWGIPVILKGYVDNMDQWMNACDILCTKAGPGTIAEGLICGLPILITGYLPGQEEANVRYIVEKKIGEFASRPAKIAAIASRWIADKDVLTAMSEAASMEARPNATLKIAADIWNVVTSRMADNAHHLERVQKIRAAQASLIRSRLMGNGTLPSPVSGSSLISQSQLLTRVQVLLRVAFGSVIAAEAAGFQIPSARLRVRQ